MAGFTENYKDLFKHILTLTLTNKYGHSYSTPLLYSSEGLSCGQGLNLWFHWYRKLTRGNSLYQCWKVLWNLGHRRVCPSGPHGSICERQDMNLDLLGSKASFLISATALFVSFINLYIGLDRFYYVWKQKIWDNHFRCGRTAITLFFQNNFGHMLKNRNI